MPTETTRYEQPVIPGLEGFCPSPTPSASRQDLILAQGRAKLSEDLYQADGRSDPLHPMHGLFTGLWDDICLKAGRSLMNHALQHPEQLQIAARSAQPPVRVDPRPDELPLEEARAIREQAHAAAAESIRLQREADLLRAQYFRGLVALHDGPGLSPFEELGTPAWRA